MSDVSRARTLVVGEHVRLQPGGPVWVVERVGTGSAVVSTKQRRTFTALDKAGNPVEVAVDGRQRLHISPVSAVYRENIEEDNECS